MKSIGIIGGETHVSEVTALAGQELEIVGAAVRRDQSDWAREQFGCPVVADYRELLDTYRPDLVAIANENDLRAPAVLAALEAGCDIIVDKPLSITPEEHDGIAGFLAAHPKRRLLNLLTLRGTSQWAGLRQVVASGDVGAPAHLHIRMAVRLKRSERPPWFLDSRRSGGLFLDLLIHGLDQVEWLTDQQICAMTAATGNLSDPADANLLDHASVFCELSGGATAVVEGQRMLPDTKGSDYRGLVAGTLGYADLDHGAGTLRVTNAAHPERKVDPLPKPASIVADWLAGGTLVDQGASLRANALAIAATESATRAARLTL